MSQTDQTIAISPSRVYVLEGQQIAHAVVDRGSFLVLHSPLAQKTLCVLIPVTANADNILKTLSHHPLFIDKGFHGNLILKCICDQSHLSSVEDWVAQLRLTEKKIVKKQIGDHETFFLNESNRLRIGANTNAPKGTEATAKTVSTSPTAASASNLQLIKSSGDAENKVVKVLIVDDSATIRDLLEKILCQDPMIKIVGKAARPSEVEGLIVSTKPDVITLDIHMPEMDGVTLLKKIQPLYHIPTVMVTSISLAESDQVFKALEIGAVDYIQKPSFAELKALAPVIIEKIKAAAVAKKSNRTSGAPAITKVSGSGHGLSNVLIAIGASTGGTEAIKHVLSTFPDQIPPVVITQHIPPVFSAAFANRLNDMFAFEVAEAKDNEPVKPNRVLIAPGGFQMRVIMANGELRLRIEDTPPVNRHKPSVDVLFNSVAEVVGKKSIGILLTGMGDDGARGLVEMKKKGSPTIAQNEQTCVVFGMPKAAIERGGAEHILPLDEVGAKIFSLLAKKAA